MSKFKAICSSDTPSLLYQNVLKNRKISERVINNLSNANENDIYDFKLLKNIEKAIEILHRFIEEEKIITLVVDCDVDGLTSTAILYQFLHDVYPKAKENLRVLMHEGKKHGMSDDIEMPIETDLLLMADAGTNDIEQQQKFVNEVKGREIIILDHHPTTEEYREVSNVCLVNSQEGDYPNKFLSGAGVAYKFIQAYGERYGYIYDIYQDIAGLGNLADAMDSTSIETRAFFNHVTDYDNIYSLYLKTLIDNDKYEKLSLKFLAWKVIPPLNAVMRIGTMEDKRDLFFGFVSRNKEEVEKAIKVAKNCKAKQDREKKKMVATCHEIIEEENLNSLGILLVNTTGIGKDSNLNGLVAQILAEHYNKPCLVYSLSNGIFVGSGRNSNLEVINNFRDWCLDTGLFELAQGHESAFGIRITQENEQRIRHLIAKTFPISDASEKMVFVDGVIDFDKLDYNEITKIAKLENLWCTTLKEPTFCIKNVRCNTKDLTRRGARKNVLSFNLDKFSFFKNFLSADFYNELTLDTCEEDIVGKEVLIDFVVTFNLNTYNGFTKTQMNIIDAYSREELFTKEVSIEDIW